MITVGSRQFKSRFGYYLNLAEAGEEFVITVRDKIKALLSYPRTSKVSTPPGFSKKKLQKKIQEMKRKGIIIGGGSYKHRPFNLVKLTPGPSSTEILRQMRDED